MKEIAKLDVLDSSYSITGRLGHSDVLIVSFNHLLSNDLSAPGFDQSYLEGLDCDLLFCKASRNDWFQCMPADLLRVAIDSSGVKYKRILFYGSSMGGYAAIYFGLRLGSVEILAISPQFTPKSNRLGFEQRWNSEWSSLQVHHESLGSLKANADSVRVVVVYDPANADGRHVDLLSEALGSQIERHEFKYAGHPAGYALSRFGGYRKFVESFFGDKVVRQFESSQWIDFVVRDPECSANAMVATAELGVDRFLIAAMAAPDVLCALSAEKLVQLSQKLAAWPDTNGLQRLFANAACSSGKVNRHMLGYASGLAARDGLKVQAQAYAERAIQGFSGAEGDFLMRRVQDCLDDAGRVFIATMQKNEGLLLLNWFLYHARLVGPESMLVLDNGSTDPETLGVLAFMKAAGASVKYEHSKREDFADKGNIILRESAAVFGASACVLLIDVDEYMYARPGRGGVEGGMDFSPAVVRAELRSVAAQLCAAIPFARIDHGYYNVPGRVAVCGWQPQRLIVHASYQGPMDLGMHLYDWGRRQNSFSADFVAAPRVGIIHCHHRSFEESREKAREKMVGRLASFDPDYLRAYRGNGVHLIKYFLMTEGDYRAEFESIETQDISLAWSASSAVFPFSGAWPRGDQRLASFKEVIA